MAKAFSVLLQDLRDGRTHDDMTQKFAELVKEVEATGRAGFVALIGKA